MFTLVFLGDAVLDQMSEDKETAESQVCAVSLMRRILCLNLVLFYFFIAIDTFSVMILSYPAHGIF